MPGWRAYTFGTHITESGSLIAKVVFGLVLALSASVFAADPAGADPSPFSVLNCNCEGGAMFQPRGTPHEQIDTGIQNGLTDLLGSAG